MGDIQKAHGCFSGALEPPKAKSQHQVEGEGLLGKGHFQIKARCIHTHAPLLPPPVSVFPLGSLFHKCVDKQDVLCSFPEDFS